MAHDSDSFIDEVTEDLRRDRLFTAFRRYGWIAGLVILGIVGGAAWREYSIAKARNAAQDWGDAVLAAEGSDQPVAALGALAGQGGAGHAALADLLIASHQQQAGAGAQAVTALDGAVQAAGNDVLLRDLARLKSVIVQGSGMDLAQRDAMLTELSQPGAPFELLALEQKAIALIGAGRDEDAATLIRQIQARDGLSDNLRRRLAEMMVTLGEEPEPAAEANPAAMGTNG
ncbi:tetratricopeptide repeat protein [Paracoccus jiaweipingae]|uniref:tetratricopeptide repeat protein n=1 Tax=unclassified Paracoccus (in: a-proteobacteria) TaxID=2688777 RepID=UPI00378889DD